MTLFFAIAFIVGIVSIVCGVGVMLLDTLTDVLSTYAANRAIAACAIVGLVAFASAISTLIIDAL